MAHDLLAGLDDVPWAQRAHAYGPADDTPGLLRRVAAGNVSDETWEAIYSSIAHQGTVYSASVAAAPFLVRLASGLHGRDLVGVLALLDCLAASARGEPETCTACARATEAGFDRYVALLADPSRDVREWAGRLVARFPERAREARGAFEAAVSAATEPALVVALLESYLAFAPLAAPAVRAYLGAWLGHADRAVAAIAGFGLLRGSTTVPERAWLGAIVREVTRPQREVACVPLRDVLREAPRVAHAALLEALLDGVPHVLDRDIAFALGEALLWLACGHRLDGAAATKPRPFVFVHSRTFVMPVGTSGGPFEAMAQLPGVAHSAIPMTDDPAPTWMCHPYVRHWDAPRDDVWAEPPARGSAPGIPIAQPVAATALTPSELSVLAALVQWRLFWTTASDLPAVYGLPTQRHAVAVLIGAESGMVPIGARRA